MTSVMVRMPLEVKNQLLERASGRPIHKMLQQDFLHEPDIQKLVDIRFKALDDKLSEWKASIDRLSMLLESNIRGLTAEQDNNDLIFDFLEDKIPGLKEHRLKIDASREMREHWAKIDALNEAEDEDFEDND